MALKVEMITFDSTDPDALAQWWANAVGGEINAVEPGEFVMVLQDGGPRLGFQRVPDPTPGKNRVHLDFTAADMNAEVDRMVALGASETGRHSFGPEFNWVVLADPEGNAFCIAGG
ncbi:putative enzyme related to lactoylglutathione lyase [Mycobacterium frederiksbergense]|uniref:Enzyme related to lactoylglutathione lyase n=1 Tax=Mycolicibacterium frederiksbergense TaxID=117567 RepID=A0ABT6L7J9_9MYCO|nr:VOC family protein [Mycolicibacterium frederiksbergense]MDH6198858.1 putative enzyme related to lactoylglutathione lyase [Mycolicibacterium frederiksbergense]